MKKTISAYTLLELMVTIAVVAILASVAVPSYNNLINNSRQKSAVNQFLSELQLARSEAVKRSKQVMMCASEDGASCSTNNDKWQEGWIIFIDDDKDNTYDSDEELIRVSDETHELLTFKATNDVSKFIRYRPSGLSRENGTFTVCDKRGADRAKSVVINITGRAQASDKDHNGGNLTCS